jgi:hypothetical protein
MNAPATGIQLPAAIGAAFEGGFLMAALMYADGPHALIKMPKAAGDFRRKVWGDPARDVAALSLIDGLANTIAMADNGSEIARKVLDLGKDCYIPAIDELGAMYCAAKPTPHETSIYGRNGINLHAIPPRLPYAFDPPKQTEIEIFRDGGAEAFETDDSYWSSTQSAGDSYHAWGQWFDDGYQSHWLKSTTGRVCVVRRVPL